MLPQFRLVVAGDGPEQQTLRSLAGQNVTFVGNASDPQMRWLYSNCVGVVCPGREAFGLTAVEAAAFGKPTAALRWGGYLDTVVEGRTGAFFDGPTPASIAGAAEVLASRRWHSATLREFSDGFSQSAFTAQLRGEAAALLAGR
jgi:glycosyltransferase involved in cell wall biosynthesis